MKTYQDIQQEESRTWLMDDPVKRNEKAQRERIRYPLLKKQMSLDHLDTSTMEVWDIGAGPLGGVSSILNCKKRLCIDPLAKEYSKYFDTKSYWAIKAEDLKKALKTPDLIIVTNALDHFEDPSQFLKDLATYMKPGAYFAHFHAINNAISHPHPAHQHNINPRMFYERLSDTFECCWYLDWQADGLTYGWLKQPAFASLYRKVIGYT